MYMQGSFLENSQYVQKTALSSVSSILSRYCVRKCRQFWRETKKCGSVEDNRWRKTHVSSKSQSKFVATMFNFIKCIQVVETFYISHSRCHLSNATKLQLLHHILTLLCAKSQVMYVEMAINCFQKIYKDGSLYSINTEQIVCMVLTLYAFSIHTATWLRKLQLNNRLAEPPE